MATLRRSLNDDTTSHDHNNNSSQDEGPQVLGGGGEAQRQRPDEAEEEEPNMNDSRFRSLDDIGRVLSQYDANRMKLTADEHRRAIDIKEQVEMSPDLDDLPDFFYGQLAIILTDETDNRHVEDAIQRCYAIQEFKQEYRIEDRFPQASRVLRQHFRLFPKQCLHFSYSPRDGTYVFAHDYAQFDPKKFRNNPDAVVDWIIMMYYAHTIYCPDFETIRRGIHVMVECQGMSMRRDVMKLYSQFSNEFLKFYPFTGKCHHYHTSAMVNVVASLLRKIMPKGELQDNFKVGCEFDGHMGDAFLTPTIQQANARMLATMESTLQLRYRNEQTFSFEED